MGPQGKGASSTFTLRTRICEGSQGPQGGAPLRRPPGHASLPLHTQTTRLCCPHPAPRRQTPPPKSPGQGRGAGLKTPLAAALLGACMTGLSEGKSEVKIREPFSLEDPRGQGCVQGGGILAASGSPDARAGSELPPAWPNPPSGELRLPHCPRAQTRPGTAQLRAGCGAWSWKTSSSAFPHLPAAAPGRAGFHSGDE